MLAMQIKWKAMQNQQENISTKSLRNNWQIINDFAWHSSFTKYFVNSLIAIFVTITDEEPSLSLGFIQNLST